MSKNFKLHLFLEKLFHIKTKRILLSLLLVHTIFFYAMHQSSNATPEIEIKIEEEELNKSTFSIPKPIGNSLAQLKQKINYDCNIYSDQINKIRKNAWEYFGQNCGLTSENWKLFIQEAEKIPTHVSIFTPPPCTFQQRIFTPNIPFHFLMSLKNNCRQSNVCFEKINIRQSTAMESVCDFLIHTPFYSSFAGTQEPTFCPDTLILDSIEYNKNSDFFNICIITAFKQEIIRIGYLFNIFYQSQTKQLENSLYHNFTNLPQQIFTQTALFSVSNFKTGILHLILRLRGAAKIVENCLTTNPQLCSRYGITEVDHEFLNAVIDIDSLKLSLHQPEKLEEQKNISQNNDQFPLTKSWEEFFSE